MSRLAAATNGPVSTKIIDAGELHPKNLTGAFREVRPPFEAIEERRQRLARLRFAIVRHNRNVDPLARLDTVAAELSHQLGVITRNGEIPFIGSVGRAHSLQRTHR
jgi:hypothetical protein